MKIDEQKLRQIFKEQQQQTERYLGVLKEDFDHKIDAVMEYVQDIPKMKDDIGVLQQDVGTLKEDVSILKLDVSTLKQDVSVLKQDVSVLKQDVAEMKPLLNTTFDEVGKMRVEMESVKKVAKNHNQRLQKIESR